MKPINRYFDLKIDIPLLRKQRDVILKIIEKGSNFEEYLEGTINVLDELLDQAEGE